MKVLNTADKLSRKIDHLFFRQSKFFRGNEVEEIFLTKFEDKIQIFLILKEVDECNQIWVLGHLQDFNFVASALVVLDVHCLPFDYLDSVLVTISL